MGGTESRLKHIWKIVACREGLIAALALLLIGWFHGSAVEDRFLLNLYYIGIALAVYVLMKRQALALSVVVVSVAAATTVGYQYFYTRPLHFDPVVDPIRDFAGWCALVLLCWCLASDAWRVQLADYRRRKQRAVEEAELSARTSALTCTSHELRSPLAAMLTINELLLDESAGPLNEAQREFLTEADRCGKHLLSLINDLLDYARAEAGQVTLAMEAVSLPDLIDHCVAIAEVQAMERGVKIAVQLDLASEEIMADPLRIKQVVLNLLSNAVKFSPPQGLVRVHARTKAGAVLISVRDTGRGMSPDEVRRLFNPYQQSGEDRETGTGLGLAISKLLVELHDGSISVRSAPGAGSLFTVNLPCRRGEARAARQKSWAAATGSESDESLELMSVA